MGWIDWLIVLLRRLFPLPGDERDVCLGVSSVQETDRVRRRWHRVILLLSVSVWVSLPCWAQMRLPQFESSKRYAGPSRNRIDTLVLAALRERGVEPAHVCSDGVFVRRVHLDLVGRLPEPGEVSRFLRSRAAGKRAQLIDDLLRREAFADYWALKWCDVLRVKAEFPINLWPNAVQAYHRWIHDALRENMPYDDFARALLTSSGSNFRAAPVNFYRAVQGQEPAAIANAVALTFMGTRFDHWPESQRHDMEAFFSRLAYKKTAEWKEEIVFLDPAPAEPLMALLPDGTRVQIRPEQDPRRVFADWLITAENPWFARCIVNRLWAWLFGRGLIHEPDDIRPDNPALYPEVLAYLEKELTRADYDLRHIYRLILNSRIYQQSSIPQSNDPRAEALFACYPVRRLDAEVLIDALCWISGTRERYASMIPEPFSFIPEEHPSIELADGSITSQFLEMFGRPTRDTGLQSERSNEPTDAQRLHLLNSTHIQKKIEGSKRLSGWIKAAKGNKRTLIGTIYVNVLSRYPTQSERIVAERYFESEGVGTRQGARDLVWALINTKEFLYRH